MVLNFILYFILTRNWSMTVFDDDFNVLFFLNFRYRGLSIISLDYIRHMWVTPGRGSRVSK